MRLKRQNQNGPQVLKNKNAQRYPSGEGVQFKLVIKKFNDNRRRTQSAKQGQIKGVNIVSAQFVTKQQKKSQPDQHAENKLADTRIDQLTTGSQEFGRIELQTDDKKQQDQADLGDDLDAGGFGNQIESHRRPDQRPGDQITENDGLTDKLKYKAQSGRRQNRNADVGKHAMHKFVSLMRHCV